MGEKINFRSGALARSPFRCKTNPPRRILLADDEPLILRLNAEVLVDFGYEVDSAADGVEAWEVLQQKSYHLLITDDEMPKVSGIDLVKKLHAARMAMPVIMATGTLAYEELGRHSWLPIEAVLPKPYTIDELLTTVSNVLR